MTNKYKHSTIHYSSPEVFCTPSPPPMCFSFFDMLSSPAVFLLENAPLVIREFWPRRSAQSTISGPWPCQFARTNLLLFPVPYHLKNSHCTEHFIVVHQNKTESWNGDRGLQMKRAKIAEKEEMAAGSL